MSYSEEKIQDALKAAKGNTTQAKKQILQWALKDQQLLISLVKPHLVGIVAHAVGRLSAGKEEAQTPKAVSTLEQPKPLQKQQYQKSTFGMDILRTIAGGDTAQFGQENYGRPLKKQRASQRHIDAIRTIVAETEKRHK